MRLWKYIFGLLVLAAAFVWLAVFSSADQNLHLIACDVGQGDALLATYGNIQILTDGGPNNKVLDCLSRHMPFWDRQLELVILTHPQKDHYGGLIDVFRRYKVDNFLYNTIDVSSSGYEALKNEVGGPQIRVINPEEGMTIRSGLIQIEILSPSVELKSQISNAKSGNLNDLSIVYLLKYGQFDALMTGDIETAISNQLAANSKIEDLDYIKVPHHGSKNGLTPALLDATNPEIAAISVGKNNSYGHPHEEVLKLLSDRGIKVLRTDLIGDIEIVTDGKRWWIQERLPALSQIHLHF